MLSNPQKPIETKFSAVQFVQLSLAANPNIPTMPEIRPYFLQLCQSLHHSLSYICTQKAPIPSNFNILPAFEPILRPQLNPHCASKYHQY